MTKIPNRKMKFKLNIVVLGFLALCFLIVAIRTVFIACFGKIDGVKYGIKAKNRRMSTNTIRANRGTIYDRNMIPLAQSATVFIVTISPNQFKSKDQKEKVFSYLCDFLKIEDKEKIHKRFYSKRKYEIIQKNVEKPEIDKLQKYIKKHKLYNIVNIEEDTKRYYPFKKLACHTIGFTGADNQGLLGLELFYNETLSGKDGKLLRIQDAQGGPMPYEFENIYPAKEGNSIVTSIDSKIQRVFDEALIDLHKWHKPNKRCLAVMQNINTGEIVALAIHPAFDLNDPFTIPDIDLFPAIAELSEKDQRAENWKNKAVSELNAPGSVHKVLTGSAALEEKVVSLKSMFNCSGCANIQGTPIHCWKTSGHGSLDLTGAFVNSCNPAFIDIGQKLGPSKFNEYLHRFGVTKKTAIDLPGRVEPIYYKGKNMPLVTLASESFGQTLSYSPLHMLNVFSTVVNGGYLYKQHILKQILDSKKNIIKTKHKKAIHQVISKKTSDIMIKILTEVVKGPQKIGTNSSVPGYKIAGKTGTAQKLQQKYETGVEQHVGSFAGLLTADNPKYVIFVSVDEPTGPKYYGSDIASPTFSRIASKIAPYLGFSPKYSEKQMEQFFNKVFACEGMPAYKAKKELLNSNFKNVKIIGDENENVVAQLPESGLNVSKDSTIYLYTDEESLKENTVEIPDILSMSLTQAKETLNSVGLNLLCENMSINNTTNKSTVMSQFPDPKTKVSKGSTVEVTFQMSDGTG